MRVLISLLVVLAVPAMAIEKASYSLVERRGDFEIRAYDSAVVAETVVDADQKSAGNRAFRRLAGYIFGGNADEQKFAMTSPVIQQPVDEGYRVSFYMPSAVEIDKMPAPNDPNVVITTLPPMMFAALRYRGGWSIQRYEEHLGVLLDLLAAEPDIEVSGEPVWARYDAPFMPSPFRTNEILIPVSITER